MLKPSLQLRLGQQLTMTPQLQQAIRLLQLSTLELQAEIQQTLESNPMLEMAEEDSELETEAASPTEAATADADASEGMDDDGEDILLEGPLADPMAPDQELSADSSWDELYDAPSTLIGAPDDLGKELLENQGGAETSLREHLLWQVRLMRLSEVDMAIATAIIDAIDDDGYLTETLEAIYSSLAGDLEGIECAEVEAILHLIQRLDPVGAGARNLGECLALQLQQYPPNTPHLAFARVLVADYLDDLATHNYPKIMRHLRLSEIELQAAIVLIQTLNPRPGAQVGQGTSEYVTPDVIVSHTNGAWRVELNPEIVPRLRINTLYASLVKRADSSRDNTYLRDQLQEARWFIKSLQSRNDTLLKVAQAIVECQCRFFEAGPEAMRPLILRDIAEQLNMHESTVSRVTSHKYMYTPRGIFEFKYFFSSHVGTADGGVCSATAIRAMIQKLIDAEDTHRPLSDSTITSALAKRGINVARRTVAKYREAMAIPPSNERKRFS